MPDITELITDDHRTVEALFERFNIGHEGAVAATIFRELAAHAEAEEHVLYPAMTQVLGADAADGSYRDHAELKTLITRARQSEGEGLVALMALIEATVAAHVAEEETELLPKLVEALDPPQLDVLCSRLIQLKQRVG